MPAVPPLPATGAGSRPRMIGGSFPPLQASGMPTIEPKSPSDRSKPDLKISLPTAGI
jgi:hypothetical protein